MNKFLTTFTYYDVAVPIFIFLCLLKIYNKILRLFTIVFCGHMNFKNPPDIEFINGYIFSHHQVKSLKCKNILRIGAAFQWAKFYLVNCDWIRVRWSLSYMPHWQQSLTFKLVIIKLTIPVYMLVPPDILPKGLVLMFRRVLSKLWRNRGGLTHM